MEIVIRSIKMPILHTEKDVIKAAQEIVRLNCVSADNFRISKQSIDARRKNDVHYVYSVTAEASGGTICDGKIICVSKPTGRIEIPHKNLGERPIVVGAGPCGLFAAYILAKSGNPPILIERGESVEKRARTIAEFWKSGRLDKNSNVQFGEGGAGTFSDGKLNTGIGDPRQRYVLETFAEHGAPRDILYKAKPHIGTDKLRGVVKSIRDEIVRLGGEVRFNSCLTDVKINGGKLEEIEVNNSESLRCRTLILAIGHSSRDTYEMLYKNSIAMQPKPFAAGVRIEHLQSMINKAQYGQENSGLPPADYKLVHNSGQRSCYSFCMCPGGQVVNASSEDKMLVVNGMSVYKRDGVNANSALVVPVRPEDFDNSSPLGGMEFQRRYERLAYDIGGGAAPVQLTKDFMIDRKSDCFEEVKPSFTGKTCFARLDRCLPEFIIKELKEGIEDFEHKIKGYADSGSVMTGVEMRTSAPVRVLRSESMQSINASGLYPAGEGAGYAGGIVSAAVDGIKCAMAVLDNKA